MDRDNLRTTTNDSIVFESVVQKTYNTELMEGVNMELWNSLGGAQYKYLFIKFHTANMKTTLHAMVKSIVGVYLSSTNNPSLEDSYKNFLKQAMSTYKYDKELDNEVHKFAVDNAMNEKMATEFKNLVYKYVCISIFKQLAKAYHASRGG